MTGTATPTRSCLKRRLHDALASSSLESTSGSSCANSLSQKSTLCKTVSFDGKEHIYFADPDYDRHSVPVAPKLSYEDLLELKMLNINLMCPQNKCAVIPIGILPLLPASDATPLPTTTAPAVVQSRPKPSGLARHLSAQNQHFVGLLDDDLVSMSSTPPPSSPSDHSPNTSGIPLPMIATDDEGQLIFQFSSSDDLEDEIIRTTPPTSSHPHHKLASSENSPKHVNTPPPAPKSGAPQSSNSGVVTPPFPVLPSPSSQANVAAMTLTPSFFSMTPQTSPTPSAPSSPFPFAPPVSTCVALPSPPPLPTSPSIDQVRPKATSSPSAIDPHHAVSSPKGLQKHQHHRSTSSPISSPKKAPATLSPLATPHASPTFTIPLHMHMGSPRATSVNPSSATHGAGASQAHTQSVIAPPGPLAALHQRHPLSPQLSGLPSPSLVPPSPLSLYPPNLDQHQPSSNGTSSPAGFFGERKRSATATIATTSGVAGHVKRASVGGPTSTLARPSSPVVKPLKS
ncbi:hypothetical protein PIIN_04625 [Serendipita indica DSM 11827]|uniref:Uncharacterized protein n=1 Tax=Serendipita indica (strain DSM 11827) TaxID=1109443 RepID=G4TH98_SERID|nr:hypothetical protein PIIN_04625 [Serendipita indica DSM 11827]